MLHRYVYHNGKILVEPSYSTYHYDLWSKMFDGNHSRLDVHNDRWSQGYYDDVDDSFDENDGSYMPDKMVPPDEIHRAITTHLYGDKTAAYFLNTIEEVDPPPGNDLWGHHSIGGIPSSVNSAVSEKFGSHPEVVSDYFEEDGENFDNSIPFMVYNGKLYPGNGSSPSHGDIPGFPWDEWYEDEDADDDEHTTAGRYFPDTHHITFYNNPIAEHVDPAMEHFSQFPKKHEAAYFHGAHKWIYDPQTDTLHGPKASHYKVGVDMLNAGHTMDDFQNGRYVFIDQGQYGDPQIDEYWQGKEMVPLDPQERERGLAAARQIEARNGSRQGAIAFPKERVGIPWSEPHFPARRFVWSALHPDPEVGPIIGTNIPPVHAQLYNKLAEKASPEDPDQMWGAPLFGGWLEYDPHSQIHTVSPVTSDGSSWDDLSPDTRRQMQAALGRWAASENVRVATTQGHIIKPITVRDSNIQSMNGAAWAQAPRWLHDPENNTTYLFRNAYHAEALRQIMETSHVDDRDYGNWYAGMVDPYNNQHTIVYSPEDANHEYGNQIVNDVDKYLGRKEAANDEYTGPDIQTVHVPTGDMGEPNGRIPGIYDSYNNIFYHGDRGGNHLPLLSHIYNEPQEDWNFADWHKPVIFKPMDDTFAWHQTIKPAIVQQMYDAIHRNIPNLREASTERPQMYNGYYNWDVDGFPFIYNEDTDQLHVGKENGYHYEIIDNNRQLLTSHNIRGRYRPEKNDYMLYNYHERAAQQHVEDALDQYFSPEPQQARESKVAGNMYNVQKYVWLNGQLKVTPPQYMHDPPFHQTMAQELGYQFGKNNDASWGYYYPDDNSLQPYHEEGNVPPEGELERLIRQRIGKVADTEDGEGWRWNDIISFCYDPFTTELHLSGIDQDYHYGLVQRHPELMDQLDRLIWGQVHEGYYHLPNGEDVSEGRTDWLSDHLNDEAPYSDDYEENEPFYNSQLTDRLKMKICQLLADKLGFPIIDQTGIYKPNETR